MKIKTLLLFSYIEDEFQTDIRCLINSNESFKNKGRITHINKSNIQLPNNEKRREKYKLNKERAERLQIELDKGRKEIGRKQKEIEKHKQMKREMLRYKSNTQEIDMNSELEDMNSYL